MVRVTHSYSVQTGTFVMGPCFAGAQEAAQKTKS